MREDKLIRSARSQGMEGILLSAAKNAALYSDDVAFLKVLSQLKELASLAKTSAEKSRLQSLLWDLRRIAKGPGSVTVMETKSLSAVKFAPTESDQSFESVDAIGTISGYGAVFGNVDYGNDQIERGAFKRTISNWKASGRLPVMLASHDNGVFPVGVWTSMEEDSVGLHITGDIANTPRGREAWNLIHMRPSALDGLSIGYSTVKSNFRGDIRLLQDLELFEVSIVALPMNPLARLTIKSAAHRSIDEALAKLKRTSESNVVPFRQPVEAETDDEDDVALAAQLLNQLSRSIRR